MRPCTYAFIQNVSTYYAHPIYIYQQSGKTAEDLKKNYGDKVHFTPLIITKIITEVLSKQFTHLHTVIFNDNIDTEYKENLSHPCNCMQRFTSDGKSLTKYGLILI